MREDALGDWTRRVAVRGRKLGLERIPKRPRS